MGLASKMQAAQGGGAGAYGAPPSGAYGAPPPGMNTQRPPGYPQPGILLELNHQFWRPQPLPQDDAFM